MSNKKPTELELRIRRYVIIVAVAVAVVLVSSVLGYYAARCTPDEEGELRATSNGVVRQCRQGKWVPYRPERSLSETGQ